MEPSSSHPGIFGIHWAKWGGNRKSRDKPARYVPRPSSSLQLDLPWCRVLLLIFRRSRIKELFGGKEQLPPCKTWPGLGPAAGHGHPHSLPCPSPPPASSPLSGCSHTFSGPPFPLAPSLFMQPRSDWPLYQSPPRHHLLQITAERLKTSTAGEELT